MVGACGNNDLLDEKTKSRIVESCFTNGSSELWCSEAALGHDTQVQV